MKRSGRPRVTDTSIMTDAQFRAYKKKLAYARSYNKDKIEWQRALRHGLTHHKSLIAFRNARHGRIKAAQTEKIVRDAIHEELPVSDDKLISTLKRLLDSLEKSVQLRKEVLDELHHI